MPSCARAPLRPVAVVYGATGTIGGAAVSSFLSRNYEVFCPVRSIARARLTLTSAFIRLFEIDLSDDNSSSAFLEVIRPHLARVRVVVSSLGQYVETGVGLHASSSATAAAALFQSNVATHINGWRALGGALMSLNSNAVYIFVTGKSGETGRKAELSVCDAAVFGVAACARAEAAEAAVRANVDDALCVVEVRLFFNVQRDEDFARCSAGEGGRCNQVRGASDFGRLFGALAEAGNALAATTGGVIRLKDVATFEATVAALNRER